MQRIQRSVKAFEFYSCCAQYCDLLLCNCFSGCDNNCLTAILRDACCKVELITIITAILKKRSFNVKHDWIVTMENLCCLAPKARPQDLGIVRRMLKVYSEPASKLS